MTDLLVRCQDFCRSHLLDKAEYFDARPAQPVQETKELQAAGLGGWWLPHGAPGSTTTSVDVVSELAYGDCGFAFGSFLPILGTVMMDLFWEPHLAASWLTAVSEQGTSIAVLASEHEAGSELAGTRTTLKRSETGLTLSGRKAFATNADAAGLLLVLAVEDTGQFTMVAVPRDTPGVRIVRRWDMQGLGGSGTYEVDLDNVTVPLDHALHGNGIRLLEVGMNFSRTLIAASGIGVARRIRDLCLDYGREKTLRGKPLARNDVFAGKLGRMEMLIDVMRNQCLGAARELDDFLAMADPAAALRRVGSTRSALAAKMFCGRAVWEIATMGSEMFGGPGYTATHPIAKLMRDARYVSVVEGGDDVTAGLLYSRYTHPATQRR